jgi:hypothetical protein
VAERVLVVVNRRVEPRVQRAAAGLVRQARSQAHVRLAAAHLRVDVAEQLFELAVRAG